MTPEEVALYVRLIGARQFALDAQLAGASVRELGVETEMTGRAFTRTTQRGYLMNQALFTMRRLLYGTTLALIAAGGYALHLGWQFNSAMQTARVALRPVFRDTQALNKELDYLFNFTKYTPFQFKDVTVAFRQMYFGLRALHYPVADVNYLLRAMTDALAAVGKDSPGQLTRVSTALQHMAYLGHLTGQVVNQLNRDGLPFTAALKDQLHLTSAQIHNIGQLNITSAQAIQALTRYVESGASGMQGAARRIATQSVHGLFTTFKDNVSQLMGYLERTPFLGAKNWLNRVNTDLGNLEAKVSAGKIHGVGGVIGALFGAGAQRVWRVVADDIHWLWVNFYNLINGFKNSTAVWAAVYLALTLLKGVLMIISPITAAFGGYMNILVPLFVYWVIVTRLAAIQEAILVGLRAAALVKTKDMTFAQFLLTASVKAYTLTLRAAAIAQGLWTVLTLGYVKGAGGQFRAMTIAEKLMLRLRKATLAMAAATALLAEETWAFTLAILANPITWIVLGVIALTAGLVILYFKWRAFHNAVDNTYHFLIRYAPYIAAALTLAFGPIGVAIGGLLLVIKYWDQLKHFIGGVFGPSGRQGANIPATAPPLVRGYTPPPLFGGIGSAPNVNIPGNLPHSATGNFFSRSGWSWVGERGPELMYVPAGATITPVQAQRQAEPWLQTQTGPQRPVVIQVMLKKNVIAEVSAEEFAKAMGRA